MGRLTNLPTRLAVSAVRRTAESTQKQADGFYHSREWRQARAECIARAFGFCALCDRREPRMFADHIVELKDGGAPLDQSNLQCLCGSCHSLKTACARTSRIAARPGP